MKKLVMFLMVAIPLFIVLIVNFTVSVVVGEVYVAVDKIEFDTTSIVANVDDRLNIKPTIYPQNATNKDLIWASDNESVAKVDQNGNVVFVGFGSGYITAKTNDGSKTAKCYFYVTDTKVHQIILASSSKLVEVGRTLQLTATIFPSEAINKNITFSSSNENIATVDSNGLVYGLSAGNVTISATTEDGGFIDFINLQVIIPVTGINLNEKEVIISKTFYNITYQITPSNATNKKINFNVSDPQIASVNSNGVVEFKQAGTVYVTLNVDGTNFEDTIKITSTYGYANELNVSKTSINMEVGQSSLLIDYNVVPLDIYNTQVTFISNNEQIVYVNESGYLTALKGGDAVITLKVEKSLNNYIVRQIYVHVESPAQNIIIDDIITAEKFVTLLPQSYPEDSTNTNFYYHSENVEIASVNENGEVEFLVDYSTNINILIYANEDYSDVYKKVNILYTAGKAYSFDLVEDRLNVEFGQTFNLKYSYQPGNINFNNINVEILNETNNSGVLKIESDGSLAAIGGGICELKISLRLYDGTLCERFCTVYVERKPEDIEIILDLEKLDGQYVTGNSYLTLNANILPNDSTTKDITWSVNDNNTAVIVEGVLIFNQAGIIVLNATCDEISKSVEIYYTGAYPISAEIGVMQDEEIVDFPKNIYVGENYEVALKNIFPSNIDNKNISLRVVNQITSSLNGQVISISGNRFSAVNGGTATIIVTISNYLQISYSLNVIRLPESINVDISENRTAEETVPLTATVLPIDTTNKQIKFVIVENDSIAYIADNILHFNANGKVVIRAYCEADSNIFSEFTVEKVEKEPIILDYTTNKFTLTVGDLAYFNIDNSFEEYDHYILEIVSQNALEGDAVLEINNDIIRVLELGKACVRLKLFRNSENYKTIDYVFEIVQYVQDIIISENIEKYNDEYITANDILNLNFNVYPENSNNKELIFEIIESYSSLGISENIAYINSNKIYFIKAGTLLLKATSKDQGGVSRIFRIKYTGGDAIDAELSVKSEIYLNIGESIQINVEKWIPSNTINKILLIKEVGHTANTQVVKIDNSSATLTALNGGVSQIIVELSNGISKEITIYVTKLINDIEVEEEILSSLSNININVSVIPSTATNKTLNFELLENTIASINGNTIVFTEPGTVYVKISTTDGSNITKLVKVTSTLGYINQIELNANEKTINKGNSFKLYVTNYLPEDIVIGDIYYKIISSISADLTNNDVVSLDNNGNIIGLYGGEVIVRAYTFDYFGNEVYADCKITVKTYVEEIDINFNNSVDNYLNSSTFITSNDELEFNKVILPSDANCKDFIYEISNTNIANIIDNKIVFYEKGSVVIKFISADSSRGEKSKTYTFIYTAGDLVEFELDKSQFTNSSLTISPNKVFVFSPLSFVPSDCSDLKYSFTNIVESRIDNLKQVGYFNGNTFYSLNGGTINFDLTVNNIFIGNFTITVKREANEIELIESENIYISTPSYNINAQALPSDTYQTQLGYISSNSSIAIVNTDGSVEFFKLGKVVVKIYIIDNPDIYKNITIEYTKELQEIYFSSSKDKMYVGEYVDFNLLSRPIDASDFEIEISLSDPSIAKITLKDGKYRLVGSSSGKVIVTAKVVGKDISCSKEFEFFEKITDIKLDLDKIDDSVGLGQYRYFGTKFLNGKSLSNKFKMQYELQPSNILNNLLEWYSSDTEIATVDKNGIVTVLKPGKVTITVRQQAPYENANVAIDYYEFTFVEGINVYNKEEFLYIETNSSELEVEAVVLQSDLFDIDKTIKLKYNLYGNGHIFDMSEASYGDMILINKSGVIIDNLTIRKKTFEGEFSLADLSQAGTLINVSSSAKNVMLYNCIVENCATGLQIMDAEVKSVGCIFRNTFYAGIKLLKAKNKEMAPYAIVEDCIFANTLLSGILFDKEPDEAVTTTPAKVTLIGEVRFYCWRTLDEMEQGFNQTLKEFFGSVDLSSAVNELTSQIKSIISKYSDYKYTYNGKDYFNAAIVSFNIQFAGMSFNSGKVEVEKSQLNANCNYTDINLTGTITLAGITNLDFDVNFTTLPGQNSFIKPTDTYINNQYVLSLIRQPKLHN